MSNTVAAVALGLSGVVAFTGFVIVVDEGVDLLMTYLARRYRNREEL